MRSRFLIIFLCILLSSCVSRIGDKRVYTTRTGSKYHNENCHYLSYSKLTISWDEAIKNQYTPCKVCKPKPVNSSQEKRQRDPINKRYKKTQNLITNQCTATARSTGKRCKRMTKNQSGKCWQHEN